MESFMAAAFSRNNKPRNVVISKEKADELVRQMKSDRSNGSGYREKSLKLHGWICAKCAREFDSSNLHQLTVHHKDGNHNNNPANGSNWENICNHCHDDEHSRGLLGDYFSK